MHYALIATASVIRYPYPWASEAGAWRDGRVGRPIAVGVRMPRPDGDLVLFFSITTKQPEASRFAAEVPAIEKRRAGLDADRRLWIIFDEFDTDILANSFHLEPEPPLGRFNKAFFLPLLREFISRRKPAREVSRFR